MSCLVAFLFGFLFGFFVVGELILGQLLGLGSVF